MTNEMVFETYDSGRCETGDRGDISDGGKIDDNLDGGNSGETSKIGGSGDGVDDGDGGDREVVVEVVVKVKMVMGLMAVK